MLKIFKNKKPQTNEETPKKKNKTKTLSIFATIVAVIVVLGLIALIVAVCIFASMLKEKPTLDINDFKTSESTVIYDRNGDQIAELGVTIRQNASYEDLPNVLVDAFVAIEDSRFFEHGGFDIPRFTKAFLENLKTMSFSQGGSTFTMQLIKNTYFVDDETGIGAPKKISRKVQEIALALELDNKLSKKIILEDYLNLLNFGSSSGQNIRGIEKAAQYYFGKSVTDINLSEAALLAGVVNAPSTYNPYRHLDYATKRRNDVLYMMYNHGYITETDYYLATSVKLEDQLVGVNATSNKGSGNGIKYQAYIDQVIAEIYELTGLDPYSTTMKVYTSMDPDVQTLMDDIQAGNTDLYEFPDDEFEVASICTNIKTGEIVGILGGRNYADGGTLLLNHATDQFKQPGSSIKPILDYSLAFENLGWATSHVLVDEPITYEGTDIVIHNSDQTYRGDVSLYEAIGYSLNTVAMKTIKQVRQQTGSDYIVKYLVSMGFDQADDLEYNDQWGIGGGTFTVSCKQMASAMGALINAGKYIAPHTITKIEFASSKNPIAPVYTSVQALSEQAAYLVDQLLYANVNDNYPNLMHILKKNDYAVYAKTGTTNWDKSGEQYNIPVGSIKDGWCVGSTTDYAVATWIGYERAYADKPSHMEYSQYVKDCIKEKTTNAILTKSVEVYGKPTRVISQPDGITNITHIVSTWPYAYPLDGMDPQYIVSGDVITKLLNMVDIAAPTISQLTGEPYLNYSSSTNTLTLTWPIYPDPAAMAGNTGLVDLSLYDADGNLLQEAKDCRKLFDISWIYGTLKYKADVIVTSSKGELATYPISTSDFSYSTNSIIFKPGDNVVVKFYYGYENSFINSQSFAKEFTIEDTTYTINQPTAINSYGDLITWAKRNFLNTENVYKEDADSSHPGGTYEIYKEGSLVTNFPIIIKASQVDSIKAVYYEEGTSDAKITIDKQYINPGDKLTVKVNISNTNETEVKNNIQFFYDPTYCSVDSVSYNQSIFSTTVEVTYVISVSDSIPQGSTLQFSAQIASLNTGTVTAVIGEKKPKK